MTDIQSIQSQFTQERLARLASRNTRQAVKSFNIPTQEKDDPQSEETETVYIHMVNIEFFEEPGEFLVPYFLNIIHRGHRMDKHVFSLQNNCSIMRTYHGELEQDKKIVSFQRSSYTSQSITHDDMAQEYYTACFQYELHDTFDGIQRTSHLALTYYVYKGHIFMAVYDGKGYPCVIKTTLDEVRQFLNEMQNTICIISHRDMWDKLHIEHPFRFFDVNLAAWVCMYTQEFGIPTIPSFEVATRYFGCPAFRYGRSYIDTIPSIGEDNGTIETRICLMLTREVVSLWEMRQVAVPVFQDIRVIGLVKDIHDMYADMYTKYSPKIV